MWIDLSEAQALLGKPGRINAILALKCHCAGSEIDNIRKEISGILPGVQVIELANKVVTRAEARDRAREAALKALKQEKANRARLRGEQEDFAAWLVPLVVLAAAAWIGLLAWMNVRERRYEIGLLRAVGLRARQIMALFLARAVLVGLAGALLGSVAGFMLGLFAGESDVEARTASALFNPALLLLVFVAAPLLAALSCWVPALSAARQDPALVLKEE
jgi:ABC-type lipoprotein release transport system permease subunit